MVRFGILSLYFERKQHQYIKNWKFGGGYSQSGLSARETNRATSRNQENIVGHLTGNLTTLPNTNAGFVINEPLLYIYKHTHTVFFCLFR